MKTSSLASFVLLIAGLALAPAYLHSGAKAQTPEAEENEFGVLKVADGVEETYYNCVACHSERIISQQGLTRDGWDELLVWMVDEQGMHVIEPEERDKILDYLSTHYNIDRPNFPH